MQKTPKDLPHTTKLSLLIYPPAWRISSLPKNSALPKEAWNPSPKLGRVFLSNIFFLHKLIDFFFFFFLSSTQIDNPSVGLACYNQEKINFIPSENPYITTNWNGHPPKPPSVKGAGAASPQSRLGTYDPNLEASNIFVTDQQQQETGSSSSPVWIQTPENNPDDLAQLAFEFPNPYPIPEDPWA